MDARTGPCSGNLRHMLHQVAHGVSGVKDWFSGQQEAQQATDRIDVNAPVWLFAEDRFRG